MKIKYLSNNNILFKFGLVAVTINPTIYIKKGVEETWLPACKYALIEHEKVHIEQQEKTGKMWFIKYTFSKKFRFSQEIEAHKVEYQYLKGNTSLANKEYFAKILSSKTYFGMVTYAEALKIVENW